MRAASSSRGCCADRDGAGATFKVVVNADGAGSVAFDDAGYGLRVLIISADMGGGHNATAAALAEVVNRRWPGSEIRTVDLLDELAPGAGRLFRAIYVCNVETTPWLYELFYSALWRRRWFAATCKQLTGSWSGRRLAGVVDRFDPSVILCTYPLGSAGLAWLRRRRGLTVPCAAWISDFAPHPFWVYRDLSANFVMHSSAVPVARAAEAGARIAVCPPPVVSRFQPDDRSAARERTGLPPTAFIALVSCGAYCFGDVVTTVRSLLAAGPQVHVVTACGHSEQTRRCVEELGVPASALTVLGWTDEMPDYLTGADLVVTNAGGATALEALACGRAIVMCEPIAAHGMANAELMALAGLADVCRTQPSLTAHVRACVADPSALRRAEARALDVARSGDLAYGVESVLTSASRPRRATPGRRWPMRSADAFFAHVDSAALPQDVGVVLRLDPTCDGAAPTLEQVRGQLGARIAGLPPLRRRAVLGPRPGWILEPVGDPARHVDEHVVDRDAGAGAVRAAVNAFLTEPLPADRPAWQARFVHGRADGTAVLAFKLHHAQGDGISALGLLDRLLSVDPDRTPVERSSPPSGGRRRSLRREIRLKARGLRSLAGRGRAPALGLNRPVRDRQRRLVMLELPAAEVRRIARRCRAHDHEVVLSVVADAAGQVLGEAGLLGPDDEILRVMLPIAMRPARLDRIFGNWTGTVALDLPLGPMAPAQRLTLVRQEVERRIGAGEPQAAGAVMAAAGRLPPRVHRALARLAYNRRFFNMIVSYMPGARGARSVAGAPVRAMIPVLPLAGRVPMTVGVIAADGTCGVGVLVDPALGLADGAIDAAFGQAFDRLRREAGTS